MNTAWEMVREVDLTGQRQAEVDALADLIEQVRSRPGITSADILAHAILDAGWWRTPKETR